MTYSDIRIMLSLKQPETQTSGVSNLKCLCMMHIYEMAAIFRFFHNGQLQYSVSVNTCKTRELNVGGVCNLNFSI